MARLPAVRERRSRNLRRRFRPWLFIAAALIFCGLAVWLRGL